MAKKTLLGKLKEEVIANPTGKTDDEVLGELIDMANTEAQLHYLTRKNHVDDPSKVRDLQWKLEVKESTISSLTNTLTATREQNTAVQEMVNYMGRLMVDQHTKTVELLADKLTTQAYKVGAAQSKPKDKDDCSDCY